MYITDSELWMLEGIEALKGQTKEQISSAIALLSGEIDEYCNTRFVPTEDKLCVDYDDYFYTRRRPLLRVAYLSLNGRRLLENKDFYVYPESARIELAAQAKGDLRKAITVRYIFGYNTVPSTVKQVIAELIKLDAESKLSVMDGIQSESWDSEHAYTKQSSKDMTPAELRKNILSRLDIFKAEAYTEAKGGRTVKAMVL